MLNKDELLKKINQEGLNAFHARFPVKTKDLSIRFEEFDEFINFIKLNNNKTVFYYYICLEKEDFLIDDDVEEEIEKDIYKLIKKDIKKYNEKVESFDFTRPIILYVFSLYNDNVVYAILEDYWHEENKLLEAEEMIEYLQENYEDILEQKELEKLEKLEKLKEELKEYMFNDDTFKICTNKDLRKNYAQTLMKNKSLKKYLNAFTSTYSDNLSIQAVVMFVEVAWAEYKNYLKNNIL